MADGELTLKLDDETARRLQATADAAGRPLADYAAELIGVSLQSEWAGTLAALAEFDRTGVSYSLEEGLAVVDAAVKARFDETSLSGSSN